MKKVYISHSKTISSYKNNLYSPLGKIKNYKFIFPHLNKKVNFSREAIKSCDYLIADVSKPSAGLGIEIGWANAFKIPITFIHRSGVKVPTYLKKISKNIIHYDDLGKEIAKIEKIINKG